MCVCMYIYIVFPFSLALAGGKFFEASDKTHPTGSDYQIPSSSAQEEETSQYQRPVSGNYFFYSC